MSDKLSRLSPTNSGLCICLKAVLKEALDGDGLYSLLLFICFWSPFDN